MSQSIRARFVAIAVMALALMLASSRPPPAIAQEPPAEPPPLSEELLEIIRQVQGADLLEDEADDPPDRPPDPGVPVVRFSALIEELDRIRATDRSTALTLDRARAELRRARTAFLGAARESGLQHLVETTNRLVTTSRLLVAAGRSGGSASAAIGALQPGVAALAERLALDVLSGARSAGVAPQRLDPALGLLARAQDQVSIGAYATAVGLFGNGLKLAADTIVFDVDLFEQNIRDTFDNETVGYAYSIAFAGQIHEGGDANGLARTAADPPVVAQTPDKEMQVASVSKTLTAILTMRQLQEHGLTPDASIAPWLPSDWSLGLGVDDLSFADVMRHRSGFKQNGVGGNTYEDLRDVIAKDVGATAFAYSNANYAMLRVLIAGLMGIDPVDYAEFESGVLTASAFILYAQQVYGSIGVSVACSSSDPEPTIQYAFPYDGSPGYEEPDRSLSCGGFGFFISANELAGVLTTLRHTEELVSAESFGLMTDRFLGFNDPEEYEWGNGTYGVYYNHGGDWGHPAGSLDACVMMFPIDVEVSLLINSTGGNYPYQCTALVNAFDNAWVPS